MNLDLVTALLRSLATVAADPALGYRGAAVISVLNLIALAVEAGANGKEELDKIQVQINDMIAEGREPDKAEWAELRARSDAAHAILNPPV